MILHFSPQRSDAVLAVSVLGDVLTINGIALDFSPLPDGATLPREAINCEWITGDAERIGGVLHVHVLLPHGPDAPNEVMFPAAMVISADGPVELPTHQETIDPEAASDD